MTGREIRGYDKLRLKDVSVAECKTACDDEDDFQCVSFEYKEDTEACDLQDVDRTTNVLVSHRRRDYYERSCEGRHI